MSDMIILTRTFDLLTWLLPKAEKFPRVYHHTVIQRMMNAALRNTLKRGNRQTAIDGQYMPGHKIRFAGC